MSSSNPSDPKLGQILIEKKLASTQQVAEAMLAQKETEVRTGERLKLGQILLFMKVITLDQLQTALRMQKNKSDLSKRSAAASQDAQQSFASTKRSKLRTPEETGFLSGIKKFFKKT